MSPPRFRRMGDRRQRNYRAMGYEINPLCLPLTPGELAKDTPMAYNI